MIVFLENHGATEVAPYGEEERRRAARSGVVLRMLATRYSLLATGARRSRAAARQRWMRADPPLAKAFTCSTVAMVVSPGKVVSSAPWAQPRLTASCSEAPLSKP